MAETAPQDLQQLVRLCRQWQDARDAGTPVSAAELCRDRPELLSELQRVVEVFDAIKPSAGSDAQRTGAYAPVSAGDLPTITTARPNTAPSGPGAGRYSVVRFHARGGLGEVYVATDTELNRPVAFKRIQPQFSDHPRSRRRFVSEAVLTARLDHPGVVPVFGLVSDPDGRPCYAMRFVHGETLGDQVTAFHAKPAGEDREPEFRRLLQRFVAICNAIGFAHSKGVIHRDIKPANVMVGAFGEVQVMDWGLAKEVGPERPAPAEQSVPDWGLIDTRDGGLDGTEPEDGTQEGAVVGTPQFMAPEQAKGETVGPAADVYSLGATLYFVLTGQPAFPRSGDLPSVLALVRRGEFPRPRQLAPRMAKALEAVCLKAMALRPDDRYATALDLAADVERWLSDAPVRCYREPLRRRLARWGRRHRVLVNSVGVGVLLAVAALAFTTVNVNAALARETVQRNKAEQRFDQAQQAVNDYLVRVADDPRLKGDDLQPLRRALLGDAQRYYSDFLQERPDEPRLRAAVAAAHLRLALTLQELGNAAGAKDEYELGLAGFRALVTENPNEPAWRIELARGYTNLGELQSAGGARADAIASLTAAAELLEPISTDPAAWEALARNFTSRGRWHKGERAEEATACARQAVAYHRLRWTAANGNSQVRQDLARSLVDFATLNNEQRRLTEAKSGYEESLGHWRAVAESGAFGFAPKEAEGRILHDLGILYEQLFDAEKAALVRSQALAVRETTAYGHGLQQFADLARTCNDYGLQRSEQGPAVKAEGARLVAEGRRIREKLAARTEAPRELLFLAESYGNEAVLAIRDREFVRAEELLSSGQAILDKLPPDSANTLDALRARALNQHNFGVLFVRQENIVKAEKKLEMSLESRSKALKLNGELTQDLSDLGSTLVMLGNAALRSDAKKAIQRYTEAVETSRKVLKSDPENLAARWMHGITVYSLANAKYRSKANLDDTAGLLEEATEAALAVRQSAPRVPQAGVVLGAQFGLVLQVRADQGRPNEVGKAAQVLEDLFADEPAKLVELARTLAVFAKAVPAGPDRATAKNAYGEKAVRVLERAVKAGFKDAGALRKEPFGVLSEREDYQAVLRKLGGNGE